MVEILSFLAGASGPWGIVCAVLLVVFAALITVFIKLAPKMYERYQDAREQRKQEEYKESSKMRNVYLSEINDQLGEFADKMGCVHGCIFEFHNGGHNNTGLNFQHMSLHYMEHKLYASGEIDEKNFENLSLGCYPHLIKSLEENQIICVNTDEEQFGNFRLFNRFKGVDANQFISFPIHGTEELIGFIILMRNSKKKIGMEELRIIGEYSQKISSLLDYPTLKKNDNGK